ncbi:hypothetical protein AAVH_39147, partial [Aphelenchoides avenae]
MEGVAKKNTTDGAQLVEQVHELAANAMYQLDGCDRCSPILQQLKAELAGLLGDLVEPDSSDYDHLIYGLAAPCGAGIVGTTDVSVPPQQFYSASSSTIQGQFGVYPPSTSTHLQHYISHASTGDAAQMVAAPSQ